MYCGGNDFLELDVLSMRAKREADSFFNEFKPGAQFKARGDLVLGNDHYKADEIITFSKPEDIGIRGLAFAYGIGLTDGRRVSLYYLREFFVPA